ncbi:hypothetical protein AB0E83_27615 [Streptomyces sp. NPDC035033]|uniref:hypothetical protein n=1 Tax=Streptomyces sp. NPDC035033 TaxID=3155368 RepID=UPI00340AF328
MRTGITPGKAQPCERSVPSGPAMQAAESQRTTCTGEVPGASALEPSLAVKNPTRQKPGTI